jgi:hypothetical protein
MQPFSDLSPMGLMSIVYCLYIEDRVFMSPRNRVAQLYPRALGNVQQEVEVEVNLRQSVDQSLGVRHPSGTSDKFSFLLGIFFRQLRVCYL